MSLQSKEEFSYLMRTQGFYILRQAIRNKDLLKRLSSDLDLACGMSEKNIPEYTTKFYDIAHHLFDKGESFIELFEDRTCIEYIDLILSNTCVVHSYNAVKLMPGRGNNATNVHRDSPRFFRDYTLSLQILYMLDTFTKKNGATYLLPGSHNVEQRPSDKLFYENAIQIEGEPGDAVIFDSAVWHSGGTNETQDPRRGITLVFTRSFMKQQIDLPRSIPVEIIQKLSTNSQRLIGMHTRVPSSLVEFNLPDEQRLYKANQG